MTPTRISARLRLLIALFAVFGLVAAACGDDDGGDDTEVEDDGADTDEGEGETDDDTDDGDTDDEGDTDDGADEGAGGDEDEERTASAKGVTEDTITVGVSMLDFAFLVENNFSPAGWGDQQGVFEALIADLNDRGGINGRTIEAVYEFYSPIGTDDASRVCSALTEDVETFAVLGGFVGPASNENACIVDLNETMLIGGVLDAAAYEAARAPWFDVEPSDDRDTTVLLDSLIQDGMADDAKVFVISHPTASGTEDAVIEAIESRDLEVVNNAVLDVDDGDQAAQDAAMATITEAVRSTDADTVFINGNPAAVIRGLINAGLNDGSLAVWNNNVDGLNNLGESINRDDVPPVITVDGKTDQEMFEDESIQECVAVVQEAFPDEEFIAPDDIAEDQENWFNSIRRYCRLLSLFEQLVTEAGVNPTYESVQEAAEGPYFDDFSIPGDPNSSIDADKPDTQDEYRLSEYDPNFSDGAAAPLGDPVDRFQ